MLARCRFSVPSNESLQGSRGVTTVCLCTTNGSETTSSAETLWVQCPSLGLGNEVWRTWPPLENGTLDPLWRMENMTPLVTWPPSQKPSNINRPTCCVTEVLPQGTSEWIVPCSDPDKTIDWSTNGWIKPLFVLATSADTHHDNKHPNAKTQQTPNTVKNLTQSNDKT